jgi:hypothetical protein
VGDPAGLCLILLAGACLAAPPTLTAYAGRSFYTFEDHAVVFVELAERHTVAVRAGDTVLATGNAPAGRMPFDIPLAKLAMGDNTLDVVLLDGDAMLAQCKVVVRRLEPKANEVKIDYASGGLIVDRRPFFPFGFYCYTNASDEPQTHLAAEETVAGFNLMCPYQSAAPNLRAQRRAYLDDCARVGMKVHYQLITQVRHALDAKRVDEVLAAVEDEVKAFRDHPALLAWYIADEPEGWKESPDVLRAVRERIAAVDPYHPVTIVIMSPKPARQYAAAMDVIMSDPYPIPAHDPEQVGQVTASLTPAFAHQKPIWIVPQAFGGNEWWRREPTRAELRLMTWRAIQEGATGIQYFIRNGLNGFPKSTVTWGEASAVAHEVAELTPDLLSDEPRPACTATPATIHAGAWRRAGRVTVSVTNTARQPSPCTVQIDGLAWSGKAHCLWEDRDVDVTDGTLSDWIDVHGTRLYQLDVAPPPPDRVAPTPDNLVPDGSFEEVAMPGVPSCCYMKIGAGHGGSYAVDSTDAIHGRHSLRLHVPDEADALTVDVNPYAVSVKPGTYRASVWARGEPLPVGAAPSPARLELRLGDCGGPDAVGHGVRHGYDLGGEWRKYVLYGTRTAAGHMLLNVVVDQPGTVWIDLLELVPEPTNPPEVVFTDATEVKLEPPTADATVVATIDGSEPTAAGPKLAAPLKLTATTTVKWLYVLDGKALSPVFTRVYRKAG